MRTAFLRPWPEAPVARAALAACLVLFAAERLAEARHAAPAWAAGSLDDLLCMPLVLAAVLAAHRVAGRPRTWRLPAVHGLAITAGYALFFELVLPRLDARATADVRDVAAYLAGFVVFHLAINRVVPRGLCPDRECRPGRRPVAG